MAMLDPDDPALAQLESAVAQMLDYVALMSSVSVDGVEPTTHALSPRNRLREDRVVASNLADALLESSPDLEDRFIAIPNVL